MVVIGCGGDSSAEGTASATQADASADGTGSDDHAETGPGNPTSGATSGATSTADSSDDDDLPPDEGPKFDVAGTPDGGWGECGKPPAPDATLKGTVYGPNGVIPVGGALVYVSEDEPAGIPQEVYCTDCTVLGCDDQSTFTEADGSFTLPAVSGAGKYLVVQKGQFMRIQPLNVSPGETQLQAAITTLPAENDPDAGEYIPRIAVGYASYDRLEDALGKFGLGDTVISAMEERLVPGTETFDMWDNGSNPSTAGFTSQGSFSELVADPDALAQYHIIFVPCTNDTYVTALSVPENVQNIRDWVAAGGRWYVADWSNEWLMMVFPEYQELAGWSGSVGSADNSSYDSLASILDPDLLEWLDALPPALKDINPLNNEAHPTLNELPMVLTVDNWSGITAINPVLVDDDNGNPVDVGHKVWLEGPGGDPVADHPLTVTGQFGCGKIQFTSYHAAEFSLAYTGLSPQELVLVYTILEIGTCQEPLPPPEG
ncbi:MAG TPA: hypothetical protein VFG69_06320 [Nannocystaceae bacterium]|nr:hypothetical protein [Nannocystaceae bacterium]